MSARVSSMTGGLHATTLGESGSWVVFCHGLFGQGKNWTQVAKVVAERHRVLLLDMPQHGKSPWTADFDYLDAADQVAAAITAAAGEEQVALVGHSMGGKIAMVLTLQHPQLVARLCVVDVAPVGYRSEHEFGGYIAAMRSLDLPALASRSDADAALAGAVPDRTVRGFLLQNLRRTEDGWSWQTNLDVLGRDLAALGDWPDEALAGVAPYQGRTLWIAGQRSPYVRDEYADEMDRWFPRNRKVTIKGAGHWVHSEQPAAFVGVMKAFLGD